MSSRRASAGTSSSLPPAFQILPVQPGPLLYEILTRHLHLSPLGGPSATVLHPPTLTWLLVVSLLHPHLWESPGGSQSSERSCPSPASHCPWIKPNPPAMASETRLPRSPHPPSRGAAAVWSWSGASDHLGLDLAPCVLALWLPFLFSSSVNRWC